MTENWEGWFIVSKLFVQTNTCFPFGRAIVLVHIRQSHLHNQPPIKTLGAEALLSFPLRPHGTRVVTISTVPEWLHWEPTLRTLCLVSSGLHCICFSLCWVCFLSFFYNKSQPWVRLYTKSWVLIANHWTWGWSWDPDPLPTNQLKPHFFTETLLTLERYQTGENTVPLS